MSLSTVGRRVEVRAPVRALDAGGWTDTWFGAPGLACNLAMEPGVHAVIEVGDRRGRSNSVALSVPSFGEQYEFERDQPPGRHRLLEAAICRWAPEGHVTVEVASHIPPG